MPRLRHLVLFRFYDEVSDELAEGARARLATVLQDERVSSWRLEWSRDDRKGRVLVEDATFETQEHFEAWRASDGHGSVAGEMSRLADWLVGDYLA